jgi:TonB family protein
MGRSQKMTMRLTLIVLIAVSLAAGTLGAAAPPLGGAQSNSTPETVRVGGDVKPPLKIKNVAPVYPPSAIQSHIEGVVILDVTIGTDGKVKDTKTIRSANILLESAAIAAVRAWEYKPTVLDGKAVQVIMTVPVNFVLE